MAIQGVYIKTTTEHTNRVFMTLTLSHFTSMAQWHITEVPQLSVLLIVW